MKGTIISMLVVLGLLVAVPMFVMNDNDLMSDLLGGGGGGSGSSGKESIMSLKAKAPKNIGAVSVKKDVKMYKWVDENGIMQFSQTPPPDGGASQEVTLKSNLNTMEAPYMPAEKEAAPASSGGFAPKNPYNPKNMKDMMRQTKDLQETMNQQMADRKEQMDKMMQ